MYRMIASPYLQLGGPLVIAGVGELLREQGISLGLYLTVLGLLVFVLAGIDQLRRRLRFRRSKLGFDMYFRWEHGTSLAALPVQSSATTPPRSPTTIARPWGLGQSSPSDIELLVLSHEWYSDPAGKMILKLRVRIHNTHDAATRSIEQHWFLFAGWPKVNGRRLSLQNPGVSQGVGPVKAGETLEGFIYATLPTTPHTGPDFELFVQDELGHETKATKA
jgi:hypothetical protein